MPAKARSRHFRCSLLRDVWRLAGRSLVAAPGMLLETEALVNVEEDVLARFATHAAPLGAASAPPRPLRVRPLVPRIAPAFSGPFAPLRTWRGASGF